MAVALRNSMWTYARREDISVSVEFAVLELRAKVLAAFGVALPEGDARKRSPWREMIKTDHPEHFSAATLKLQEQDYESNGIFDLGRYEDSPVATATLIAIIEQFHRRGTKGRPSGDAPAFDPQSTDPIRGLTSTRAAIAPYCSGE